MGLEARTFICSKVAAFFRAHTLNVTATAALTHIPWNFLHRVSSAAIFANVSHMHARTHTHTKQYYIAREHFTWISRSRKNPAKVQAPASS